MPIENVNTEIVKVGSDEIEAARDTKGNGWVVVKKVCDVLGLDSRSQQKRLDRQPWTVKAMMTLTGSDGKNYEQYCISVDSTPMWLATIQSARVTPKAKAKLIQFQKLAAKALADWAYGRNVQQGSSFSMDRLNDTLDKLTEAMATLTAHVMTLKVEGTLRAPSATEGHFDEDDVDLTKVPARKIRKMLGKIVSRSTDRGHGYEFRYGWDQLYRMYSNDSGIDLHKMAIQLSQTSTSGKEIKPLDLAEKWGHLVPLYRFALVHMKTGAPRVLPAPGVQSKGKTEISAEDLRGISDFDSFYT
jgi:hypothetical protein